ncbi:MAG: hypothetical protein GEV04_18955 [Actinophytocola sp.]|nr:hypothetical protein [Actinophytocola sp.]
MAELTVAYERERAALAEAVFTGEPMAGTTTWEMATVLGFPDSDLVVVTAEPRRVAEDALPAIEQRLAERGMASVWRFSPVLQLAVVAVAAVRRVGHAGAGGRTCQGWDQQAVPGLGETPRALRLARRPRVVGHDVPLSESSKE